jgi:hypothetical protein
MAIGVGNGVSTLKRRYVHVDQNQIRSRFDEQAEDPARVGRAISGLVSPFAAMTRNLDLGGGSGIASLREPPGSRP